MHFGAHRPRAGKTTFKHGGQKFQVSAGDQFIKICRDELVATRVTMEQRLEEPRAPA
jgi:hypothetical protein